MSHVPKYLLKLSLTLETMLFTFTIREIGFLSVFPDSEGEVNSHDRYICINAA